MRLKGIGVVEQHVEKLVLAVMMVVLLGVVSMQFLYQPNLVDAGSRKVPPQAVFGELRKEVERLKAEVNNPEPGLPEVQTPGLLERYEQVIKNTGGLPGELDVAFGRAPQIGGEAEVGPASDGPMMAMTVPAPASAIGKSQWISVDPYALEENPELVAYLPVEQPFDVAGVSVEATIDGRALADLLREGDGTHRPIPSSWVRGRVAVMEVVAERQEQNIDGSWGPGQAVGRIPGSFDLLKEAGLTGQPTPVQLRELVDSAEQSVERIARPEYLPAIAGPEWLAPTRAIERDEQMASMSEVDLLKHKRKRLLDRIEQQRKRLEDRPDDQRTPTREPGGEFINPGSIKGATPGGRTDPRGTQRDAEQKRLAEERRRALIQKTIDDLTRQVEETEQQLADMGFPVTKEQDRAADRDTPETEAASGERLLLGNEAFKVWAHDLDVVPGAVYRYRLCVKVNNPIYGKERLLDAAAGDDPALAGSPYAMSDWSAWTEPVMVGRQTYLFLTNASEAKAGGELLAAVGGGSAKVAAEVYHMYYGHYRRGTATLSPGDSVSTDVRVPDKLYVFDTELVSKDEAYRLAGVTPKEPRPGFFPAPSRRLPGAPLDERTPSEFVPMPAQTQPAGGRPLPGQPFQPALVEPEVLPEGVTKTPTRVSVAMGSTLLDVVELAVEIPGGGTRPKPMIYAYFETEGGVVEHRRVDLDTQSRAYELVRASYRLGEPEEGEEPVTP